VKFIPSHAPVILDLTLKTTLKFVAFDEVTVGAPFYCPRCIYIHRVPTEVTRKFKSIYIQYDSTEIHVI